MRLEAIEIDGYGHFHDVSVPDIAPGVTVFLGCNESGKTTLLAFIRAVLFGFPDGRSKENSYPPLRGGNHGGRLVVEQDSTRYVIQRHQGTGGGKVTVFVSGDRAGGQELLRQLLGSATRDLYRNIFAFSLTELQRFKSFQDEEIRSTLYSAGLGSSGLNLPNVEKGLCAQADRLFLPGGRKQEVSRRLKILEENQKEIRELSRLPGDYQQICRQNEQLAATLAQLRVEQTERQARLEGLSRLRQAWDVWIEMEDARRQLEALDPIEDFPVDGVPRLQSYLEKHQGLTADIEARETQQEDLKDKLPSLVLDQRLLAAATDVRGLARGRDEWDQLCRSIPLRKAQLANDERALREHLRDLGPHWDETRLRSQDTSIPFREMIRSHREELNVARSTFQNAETRCAEAQQRQSDAQTDVERLEAELEQQPAVDPRLSETKLAEVTPLRQQWQTLQDRLEEETQELDQAMTAAAATLANLGAAWDKKDVLACDCSREVRDELRRSQRTLDESATTRQQAVFRFSQAGQLLDEEADKSQRAQRLFEDHARPAVDSTQSLRERRDGIRQVRSALRQRDEAHSRIVRDEERKRDTEEALSAASAGGGSLPLWVLPLPFVGCLILAMVLYLREEKAVGGAVLVCGILASGAMAAFRNSALRRSAGRRASLQQSLDEIVASLEKGRALLEKHEQELRNQGKGLGLAGLPSHADLDNLEGRLQDEEAQLWEWQSAEKAWETAKLAYSSCLKKVETLRADAERAEDDHSTAQNQWKDWLQQRGLDSTESPESVADLLQRVETCQERLHLVGRLEERVKRADNRLEQERSSIRDTLVRCGRTLPDDARVPQELARLLSDLERDQRVRETVQWVKTRLAEARQAASRAERDGEERQAAKDGAAEVLAQAQSAWADWLGEAGLDDSLRPETALEVLERIGSCQDQLRALDRLRDEVIQDERRLQGFLHQVQQVFKAAGRSIPARENVAGEIDRLLEDLDVETKRQQTRDQTISDLKKCGEELGRLNTRLQEVESELEDLMEVAGAHTEEDFRARAESFAKITGLQERIAARNLTMEKLGAVGDAREAMLEELSCSTLESLESQQREVETAIEETASEATGLEKEAGKLQERLQVMASSRELSSLRESSEAEKESLRVDAWNWSVATVTLQLLKKARHKYERERQPRVIQLAQEHFRRITDGRYAHIYAPPGETRIEVELPDGTRKEPGLLSRGTAEQLYLALRLGFVQEFSRRSRPLPIVMDDIFVNFDPGRAEATLAALYELSQEQQILIFTCHPETAERARWVSKSIHIRHMADEVAVASAVT